MKTGAAAELRLGAPRAKHSLGLEESAVLRGEAGRMVVFRAKEARVPRFARHKRAERSCLKVSLACEDPLLRREHRRSFPFSSLFRSGYRLELSDELDHLRSARRDGIAAACAVLLYAARRNQRLHKGIELSLAHMEKLSNLLLAFAHPFPIQRLGLQLGEQAQKPI